ncbi:hypothetical protein [Streptomyces virginiae]
MHTTARSRRTVRPALPSRVDTVIEEAVERHTAAMRALGWWASPDPDEHADDPPAPIDTTF